MQHHFIILFIRLFPGVENTLSDKNAFEMMDGKGVTLISESESDEEVTEDEDKNYYTFI